MRAVLWCRSLPQETIKCPKTVLAVASVINWVKKSWDILDIYTELPFLAAFAIWMFWAISQRWHLSKFSRHSRTHNREPHRSQRESTAYCCLFPHINTLTRTIYAYTFQRALRSVSYGGVVQTCAAVPAQPGRGKPCHACQVPDMLHWYQWNLRGVTRGALQKHKHILAQKKAVAQKPAECQKWHNENNESRLHSAKDVEGCLWPLGKLFLFYYLVSTSDEKKRKRKWLVSRLRSHSAILWRATLPWRTIVLRLFWGAATEYMSIATWGILLSPSRDTKDDLTTAKETNRLHVCKLIKAGQKSDLLHWMPILGCPGESRR